MGRSVVEVSSSSSMPNSKHRSSNSSVVYLKKCYSPSVEITLELNLLSTQSFEEVRLIDADGRHFAQKRPLKERLPLERPNPIYDYNELAQSDYSCDLARLKLFNYESNEVTIVALKRRPQEEVACGWSVQALLCTLIRIS